jgi:hypothetical protein
MQLQKAYKDRWSNARGSAYAGVGGGSSLELLGLFGLGQSGDADEYY